MRFVTTLKWFVDGLNVYYMCASVFLCLKCILLSKSHWDYPLCSVIYSHRAKCLQKFIPTRDKKEEQSPYSGLLNRCFVWMCFSLELWLHACKCILQSWLFSHFTIHFFSIQVQYTSLFMEFCCTGSFIDVIHLLYYLYQAANQKITRHNWAPF